MSITNGFLGILKVPAQKVGAGSTYRGEFDASDTYYHNENRRDIVSYNGSYYLTNNLSLNGSLGSVWGNPDGANWSSFGAEFSSVATDIGLFQDAIIRRGLVLGEETVGPDTFNGFIRSWNVGGLLTNDSGLFLSNEAGGIVRFGNANGTSLVKGMAWDGVDFQVKGSNFELTKDGKLWANAGGFGGTVLNPAISITSEGIKGASGGVDRVFFRVNETANTLLWDTYGTARKTNVTVTDGVFANIANWSIVTGSDTTNYSRALFTHPAPVNSNPVLRIMGSSPDGTPTQLMEVISNTIISGATAGNPKTFNLKINVDRGEPITSGSQATLKDNGIAWIKIVKTGYTNTSNTVDIIKYIPVPKNTNNAFVPFDFSFTTDATNFKVVFGYYANGELELASNLVYFDDLVIEAWEGFSELSQKGLMAFASPAQYIKAGPNTFELKGGTAEFEKVIVKGNLEVYGDFVAVSQQHTHNLDSILDGTTYGRVKNTALTSGEIDLSKTGVINKLTTHIAEGTNQYFTTARARASISGTAPVTYNSTTGAIGFSHNATNLKITSNALNTIQDIATTSSPTFAALNITGAITASVLSVQTLQYAQVINVDDNLLIINNAETGAGVSSGVAGIEVERGTLTNYQFMFRESDDSFVVGESNDLQAVATREDTPTSNGFAIWNNTAYRFDTVTRTITAGAGLSGGGTLNTGNLTLSHADTSSIANISNSNGTVIQSATFDTYGHILTATSIDLDGRYYTETEADARFVNVTGDTMTGLLHIGNSQYKQLSMTGTGSQKLWFGSVADSVGSYIANNTFYNNSWNFTPNYTSASGIIFKPAGDIEFFINTGLTVGVDHTRNILLTLNTTGTLSLGAQATATSHAVRADRALTISGTTNQVNVSGGSQNLTADRTWTLSLPQDIHSTATPSFTQVALGAAATTTSHAVRADRSITITTTSPLTGTATQDLTANRTWTLGINTGDILLGTNTTGLSWTGTNTSRLVGTGNLSLNLPQRIDTAATPTFAKLTLGTANAEPHLILIRDNYNYIQASNANGTIAFLTGGAAASDAGSTLVLSFDKTATFKGNVVLSLQASTTSHAVRADRSISTSYPLTGGGNLTADRTIALSYNATNLRLTSNALNTIQDIDQTASPTFASLTLSLTANPTLTLTDANRSWSIRNDSQVFKIRNITGSYDAFQIATDNKVNMPSSVKIGAVGAAAYPLDVTGKIYSNTEVQGGSAVIKTGTGYALFGSNALATGVKVVLNNDTSRTDLVVAPTSGNIIIGSATDNGYKLDVTGTGRFTDWIYTNANKGLYALGDFYVKDSAGNNRFTFNASSNYLYAQSTGSLFFYTNGSERFKIDNLGDSLFTPGTIVKIANDKAIGSSSFTSGYLGAGWRLWDDSDPNETFLELDNMIIRNTLRAHIFQKDVVRASNGYLFMSDVSVIAAESISPATTGLTGYIYVKEQVFQPGDILWYKDIDESTGLSITGIKITITDGGSSVSLASDPGNGEGTAYKYAYTLYSGTNAIFKTGGTIVRVGGTTRPGSIYFDASSPSTAPFMDIYDDVYTWDDFGNSAKTKVRIGKLKGMTSSIYGVLQGHGIFTRNGYFEGNVNIAGTLTAGDANGVGNAFYAGKIKKNLTTYSHGFFQNTTSNQYWASSVWGTVNSYSTSYPEAVLDGETVRVRRNTYTGATASNATYFAVYPYNNNKIPGSEDLTVFTLSFYIRANRALTLNAFGYGWPTYTVQSWTSLITDRDVTTEWKKVAIVGFTTRTTVDNTDVAPILSFSLNQNDWFEISHMQLEYGSLLTAYQPTDSILSSDTGYGMWASLGGFGGTIQNPVVGVYNYGLEIRNAGYSQALTANTIMIGNITGTANGGIKITRTSDTSTSGVFGYTALGAESFAIRLDGTAKIAGSYFDSASIWTGQTDKATITFGGANAGIVINSDGSIVSKEFRITTTGDADFSGNLSAANGTFAGTVTAGSAKLGNDVNGSNDGLYLGNADNYWYDGGSFKMGTSTNYISHSSSVITLVGTGTSSLSFQTSNKGIYFDGSGNSFRVGSATASRLQWNGTDIEGYNSSNQEVFSLGGTNHIAGWSFTTTTLSKGTFAITSGTNTFISIGQATDAYGNAGIYLGDDNGTVRFSLVGTTDNSLQMSGAGTLAINSTNFYLKGSTTLYIDTTKVAVGTSAAALTVAGTSQGTVIDNTGGFLSYGDADNYIRRSGTSLDIKSKTFALSASNLLLNTTTFYLGTITSDADSTGSGVFMNSSGVFRVFGNSTNYITVASGSLNIASDSFDLLTTGTNKVGINGTRIALGATLPTAYNAGTGFYVDNTGKFLAGIHNGNRIQWSGSEVTIVATNAQITGTSGWLGGSTILAWSGSTVTAAGWTVGANYINKTNTYLSSTNQFWTSQTSTSLLNQSGVTLYNGWTKTGTYSQVNTPTGVASMRLNPGMSAGATSTATSASIATGASAGNPKIIEVSISYYAANSYGAKYEIFDALDLVNPIKTGQLSRFTNNTITILAVTLDTTAANIVIKFTAYGNEELGGSDYYFTNVTVLRWNDFVELSNKGFHAFRSPSQQIKFGNDAIIIKGADAEFETVTIKGDLNILGTTYQAANDLLGTTSNNFTIDTDLSSTTTRELRFGGASNYLRWQSTGYTLSNQLTVTGDFYVTSGYSKYFLAENPSGIKDKTDKIKYVALEGNEKAVFLHGKIKGSENKLVLSLPKEWLWLVDRDSITVQLTPETEYAKLSYEIIDNQVIINIHNLFNKKWTISYLILATRKDVAKLDPYGV